MTNLFMSINTRKKLFETRLRNHLSAKKKGADIVEMLIIMVIAVVVGALLLAAMRTAMPDLFDTVIDKITNWFI